MTYRYDNTYMNRVSGHIRSYLNTLEGSEQVLTEIAFDNFLRWLDSQLEKYDPVSAPRRYMNQEGEWEYP